MSFTRHRKFVAQLAAQPQGQNQGAAVYLIRTPAFAAHPYQRDELVIGGSTIDQRQNQVVVRIERRGGLMQAGEVMSVPLYQRRRGRTAQPAVGPVLANLCGRDDGA